MTSQSLLKYLFFIIFFASAAVEGQAQVITASSRVKESVIKAKPYKLLTSGRQVTIRSSEIIESVMVWTSGGHRVLEEKEIQKELYQFRLTVPARIYFIMLRMNNGKVYSEKIGIAE